MFSRKTHILTLVIFFITLIAIYGCDTTRNSCEPEVIYRCDDGMPPAIPRGVQSITGDEKVTVEWYPNGENDLAGYSVWRSRDDRDFDLLDEVSADTTSYVDRDVRNGETYYYAVAAFDTQGNESELSIESVDDTPRPEGIITLFDYTITPDKSGFDFSRPERGAIPWDASYTDIYFGFDEEVHVFYMYSDNDTEMQDMGYRDDMDKLDESPENPLGFTTLFVEMLEGHAYIFYTPDGHCAKIWVTEITDDAITFDWAYQIDRENTELAPALSASQKGG